MIYINTVIENSLIIIDHTKKEGVNTFATGSPMQ